MNNISFQARSVTSTDDCSHDFQSCHTKLCILTKLHLLLGFLQSNETFKHINLTHLQYKKRFWQTVEVNYQYILEKCLTDQNTEQELFQRRWKWQKYGNMY